MKALGVLHINRKGKTERSRAKLAPKVPSEKNNVKHRTEAREHKVEKQEELEGAKSCHNDSSSGNRPETVSWVSVCSHGCTPTGRCVYTHGTIPQELPTLDEAGLALTE